MKKLTEDQGTELYGKELKDGKDTYKSLLDSDSLFVWDYKVMTRADSDTKGGDFLKRLDALLKPLGCQVVVVGFDGDCHPWTIEKIQ